MDREKQFDLPLNPMFEIEDEPKTGPRYNCYFDKLRFRTLLKFFKYGKHLVEKQTIFFWIFIKNIFITLFFRLDAMVESDETFHEGEMLNLTPVKGNIHSFTAVKDTIILDILTPYYDQQTRFCNFYAEVDQLKPGLKSKKIKKEVSEEDKKMSGYKTTLIYLYEPSPAINFEILPCSEGLLKEIS